ncbi:UDP-diphosphatase [Halobaculum sp. WSA2]|uniref:Undecaprenyl-diphosphatase n=1 Tax=Halobaculum saliterrae TaxID=2073113 RepID=A0A6B0SWC4_9EURY|nr:undecaprenyl-diphosphate phosphatase [Halobaculum saliterrae]MXR41836.1 UDP-diphosphatase [Halobaculum saliterrae]
MDRSLVVALVVGVLQGVFEWLPISSEGNITIALSALGRSPDTAVAFALFLHFGTALSATVYYRGELASIAARVPRWRPDAAFEGDQAVVSFLAVGTLVSGVVGIAAYATLEEVVSALTGGAVVVGIGVLLVLTGVFQRISSGLDVDPRREPDAGDAVLVGVAQGLAILPGISRSGMTTGTLLLRGHDAPDAFRYSFVLSIPAAVGGGLLAYLDTGLGAVTPLAALVSLAAACIVGYATIDALVRVVERVSFWAVCLGLGALAVAGGVLVL